MDVIKGSASPAGRARIGPTRVGQDDKEQLRPMLTTADPVMLFTGFRAAQEDLARRLDRRGVHVTP